MSYRGQGGGETTLIGAERQGHIFTEKDRRAARAALGGTVSPAILTRLETLAFDETNPSHPARILLGELVEKVTSGGELDLPTDRSGLQIGYDATMGHVWDIQGRLFAEEI